jgi:GNAT superfamily N-acetyltransferase
MVDREHLIDILQECLPTDVDAWFASAVAEIGARATAAHLIDDVDGFEHAPLWWEALVVDEQPVGVVLPVTFTGCARDGLDEGTILHVGVRAGRRGAGFGRILLRRAVTQLSEHGVWRIYSDTSADNVGMIRLFEREGWQREPAHERPVFTAGDVAD